MNKKKVSIFQFPVFHLMLQPLGHSLVEATIVKLAIFIQKFREKKMYVLYMSKVILHLYR